MTFTVSSGTLNPSIPYHTIVSLQALLFVKVPFYKYCSTFDVELAPYEINLLLLLLFVNFKFKVYGAITRHG